MRSDVCATDRHDLCMGKLRPDWCGCECHVLLPEDLSPMTPEQIAWVRAQRSSAGEHTGGES